MGMLGQEEEKEGGGKGNDKGASGTSKKEEHEEEVGEEKGGRKDVSRMDKGEGNVEENGGGKVMTLVLWECQLWRRNRVVEMAVTKELPWFLWVILWRIKRVEEKGH